MKEFVISANRKNFKLKRYYYLAHARGTAEPYSDIDLAIFSPQFVENRFENIKMIQGTKRLPQMELHLYPSKEYNEDFFCSGNKKTRN